MIAGTSAFLASAATRVKNIYFGHSESSDVMLLSASGMQTSPLSSGIFWQESVYHKKCKSLRSLQVQNPSPSNQGLA